MYSVFVLFQVSLKRLTLKKDGQFWKRRTVMEKMDSYGKDGQLWKRLTVMEKTGT